MCIICKEQEYEKLGILKKFFYRSKLNSMKRLCGNRLYCNECPNLTTIPHTKNIEILYCYNCPNLKEIPYIAGLKKLYCSSCPLLTSIPHIKGLEVLYCGNCPNLKEIPDIEELEVLNCENCPLLTSIPKFERLEYLTCGNCPLLTSIPKIKTELLCYNCRYIFSTTAKYVYFSPPWLNHPDNEDYKDNIKKLIKIQRWFRNRL